MMHATRWYGLVLGILTVWRVAHLFYAEDGPGDVFIKLRVWAGTGVWGTVLDCFYCLSLWIAAPLTLVLGEGWEERALLIPALSAGAILLERVTNRGLDHGPPADIPTILEVPDVLHQQAIANADEQRVSP